MKTGAKFGHLVSLETRRKISEHSFFKGKTREKSFNWNGGQTIDCFGYVCIYKPDHPTCNQRGYVKEHRLVMEKHLGRYLSRTEIVHHLNGIKKDNRIENLELTTNAQHSRIETKKRWENGFKRKQQTSNRGWFKKGHLPKHLEPSIDKKCHICKKTFKVQNYRKYSAKYCSRKCQFISQRKTHT